MATRRRSGATQSAITAAIDSYLASLYRREILVERATRGMALDLSRDLRRRIDSPVIAAVAALLAGRERPAPIRIGGAELPPPPERLPDALRASLSGILHNAAEQSWRDVVRPELIELAEQEVAFSGAAVTAAHRDTRVLSGPLADMPAPAIGTAGLMVPPQAAVLSHQITQRAIESPMLGATAQRTWGALLEGLQDRVETQVGGALQRGESVEAIVRSLRGTRALKYEDGILGKWRRGAVQSFVRTANTHITTQTREASYASLGAPYVQLVATLDLRTTPICIRLDKTIWPNGEGPRPPLHPGCRTGTAPVWNRDDPDPARRASFQGQVSGELDARTWFETELTMAQQVQLVGPTLAEALASGKIRFDQLFGPALETLGVRDLRAQGLL